MTGTCRVIGSNVGNCIVMFNHESFATEETPIHIGPVKLPSATADGIVVGDILYGVAVFQPDFKTFLFRWCTRAPELFRLHRILKENSPDAITRDKSLLRIGGNDDLALMGFLLSGDLLHIVKVAEDGASLALKKMNQNRKNQKCDLQLQDDVRDKPAMQAVEQNTLSDRFSLNLSDEVVTAPQNFVLAVSLFCRAPELFVRVHRLLKIRSDHVAPRVLKDMDRICSKMTTEVMDAFTDVQRKNIYGTRGNDATDSACFMIDGDAVDGDDSDWSV